MNCFLGIDLDSAYTKFTVIDEFGTPVFSKGICCRHSIRAWQAMKNVLQAIHGVFNIKYSCATGYGRKHFTDTDICKDRD
jgi:activator of 2-hydroxyglutaryl-CoA dehydratase